MRNHKNILSIFFAIVLLFPAYTASYAQVPKSDQQQSFEDANNLFNQSKFTASAQIYQRLLDQGVNQKSVYFNAGNAYYKAGKNSLAIYNYEKALQLSPNDAAVKHNLSIANQKVNGYVGELPLVFFQQWWLQLQHLHKANEWAIGSILFFWLLITAITLNTFLPGWKNKFLRWGSYVAGAVFLLYLLMAVDTYLVANNHQSGIVINSNIKVKTAPDENSKDAFEIQEGMKVHVTDATKDFCKIELADGKSGWISCAYIKRL
jgi:tetratricopeptide (TPR) repeat protein